MRSRSSCSRRWRRTASPACSSTCVGVVGCGQLLCGGAGHAAAVESRASYPDGFAAVCCRRLHERKLQTRSVELDAFHSAKERKILRNIAYLIIFVLVAFMAFINLIFCVKFTTEQKAAWITGILLGLFAGTVLATRNTAVASTAR